MLDIGHLLGFTIAILVGFWAGTDAQKRGMSGWWGFWVACIMIIFLPLYLIIRKPKIKD